MERRLSFIGNLKRNSFGKLAGRKSVEKDKRKSSEKVDMELEIQLHYTRLCLYL